MFIGLNLVIYKVIRKVREFVSSLVLEHGSSKSAELLYFTYKLKNL